MSASCGSMFATRNSVTIHSRPLMRPTPIAYALRSDRSVPNTATSAEMKTEFQSFCGKFVRVQKFCTPSR